MTNLDGHSEFDWRDYWSLCRRTNFKYFIGFGNAFDRHFDFHHWDIDCVAVGRKIRLREASISNGGIGVLFRFLFYLR